jgi:predicted DNA-binding transcriptional regulator AlpA
MMNTLNLARLASEKAEISVTVKLSDLEKFGDYLVGITKRELEQAVIDNNAETFPTPKQVSQILGVDLVTLWRWKNRGYLVPVEIGGKRRYLMSEVKALLTPDKKKRLNNGK